MRSAAAAVVLLGVAARVAVFRYSGPSYQPAFNAYLFSHGWWSYSDIASLWFRDHLRHHPVPYFDYRLEYPVVTGALIGLVSQITSSVSSYFVATSAVLAGCAAGFVALVRRIPNACGWLFALSPTLLLYGVTNWDLLGLLPTAGALVLYLRRRDLPASALLAVAASTKLFPALLLPFVLLVQVREGRVNAALRSAGVFVAVTLALNVVPAIAAWRNWSYFFTYNDSRHPELSVWRLVAHGLHTGQVNEISELLVAALIVGLLVVVARRFRNDRLVLVPAFGAAIAGALFLNKIYSPQYSLWLLAALALTGAPVLLVAVLAGGDVAYDWASFHIFAIHTQPQHHDFYENVLLPMGAVHETIVLAIFAWCLTRLYRGVSMTSGISRSVLS